MPQPNTLPQDPAGDGWRVGDAGRTIFGPPTGAPVPATIARVEPGPHMKARARKLAAAPRMLAALKTLIASLEWEERRSGTTYHGIDEARAVVALVEGRAS